MKCKICEEEMKVALSNVKEKSTGWFGLKTETISEPVFYYCDNEYCFYYLWVIFNKDCKNIK